jgi:glycosyltransferase involved in cell wall biosynthesis
MRIAVVNWSNRRVGGVETYLNTIIPELSRAGQQIAFLHEVDEPANRDRIALPESVPNWCVAALGAAAALRKLRDWQPDLIYSHGLLDPKLESSTIEIAPAVFFAHNYYGTCISGTKTFKNPVVTPCDRRFGLQCLLHYYPHRCGGWSPVTMLREYHRQAQRLELLSDYKAIVTHSAHMRAEYVKHGIAAERVHDFLYYVKDSEQDHRVVPDTSDLVNISIARQDGVALEASATSNGTKPEWRLLFLGRMDLLKGGSEFLDALPLVTTGLKRRLHVTFAGDGPKRHTWERKARLLAARHSELKIEFAGWLKGEPLDSVMAHCDLLVLPSLWPEPFGLVGPEVGLRGVPVAAFAVGGIPNWLVDGINGHLAPGDPPTAEGLAGAIIKCLRDPATHARLGQGAAEMAKRFDMQSHRSALMKVFETVVSRGQ